jgi:hypothetical protein
MNGEGWLSKKLCRHLHVSKHASHWQVHRGRVNQTHVSTSYLHAYKELDMFNFVDDRMALGVQALRDLQDANTHRPLKLSVDDPQA